MKAKKHSLLISIISLILCFSMLMGTTFAWFTDQVVSGKNTIAAGNLDVELYHSNAAVTGERVKTDTLLFKDLQGNPILWEPGVVSYENLRVTNAGDLALLYRMTLETFNENYVVYEDGSQYGLSQVLKVGVVEGGITATDRAGVVASVPGTNWTTLADFQRSGSLLPAGKGESEKTWGVVIYWQPGDNDYDNLWNLNNGKKLNTGDVLSIELGVKLEATQYTSEMDSFGDQYDAGAIFPGLDLPATGSAPVTPTAENTVPDGGVQIPLGDVVITVPAGTKLLPGTTSLPASFSNVDQTQSNVILGATEKMRALDIHVDNIAADNTVPLQIYIPEALSAGLNIGNYHFYHVENGATNEMVSVPTLADLNAHNQFYYDVATGDVTLFMASFSEVVAVTDYLNPWKGAADFSWYKSDATTLSIANGDQLWAFSQIVGGMNGQTQDSFKGKTVLLTSDINLGDAEDHNDESKTFYPIGYTNNTGSYTKQSGNVGPEGAAVYSTVHSFEGTFDGQGHTIADFYQNTWDMFGDYNNGYTGTPNHYKDAMGLFGYVVGTHDSNGKPIDGIVKNLTVENFSSDGEFTPTGVIAAYTDGGTFQNIALVNCNPRVYNTGNGGIVGIGGDEEDTSDAKITFENITIDNTNKITALWGSWDVACGGLMGMFRGNGHVYMNNCHVGAQIDVYNDVCGNYQYYWYRYAGMLIGTNFNMVTDDAGYTVPKIDQYSATGCTVHFGDWNDYYYCELVENSLASYTHDHQMSRLVQIQSVTEIQDGSGNWNQTGNFIVMNGKTPTDKCYHIRKDASGNFYEHDHSESGYDAGIDENKDGEDDLKEDKQRVFLPFNQLFTGYGWGVKHVPIYDDGTPNPFAGVTILGRDTADSVQKFVPDSSFEYIITPSSQSGSIGRVYVSDLFSAAKSQTGLSDLDPYKINFSTLMVSVTDITDTGITAEYRPYTGSETGWGTLWFKPRAGTTQSQNPGMVKITIQDYQYCEPTSIYATVIWGTITNYMNAGNAVNAAAAKMTTDDVFGSGDVIALCPHCKKDVTWHDLNAAVAGGNYVANAYDHYYLSDNLVMQDQEVVFEDSYDAKKFCLHLNGKSLKNVGEDKAAIQVKSGATLSIMGDGNVSGPGLRAGSYGSKNGYPGAAVDNRSILNLYGGTYASNKKDRPVISMFDATGPDSAYAINMYNGTVIDGTPVDNTDQAAPVLEDDANDTDIKDDTTEEIDNNKRSTAVVVVHGKNHNFNMYGGVIKNGNNQNSGGNVYVYRSTFNMWGGAIEDGYANRGGNVFVGYGGDGRFYLRGGEIRYGSAWNLGGNVFNANAFIMMGGKILGGQVLMPYSIDSETKKVSGGSGGSLAVVGGQLHIQGGVVDGTLPSGEKNAYFGGLAHIARGEMHISGTAVLKNGKIDPKYSFSDAINVQVIVDSSVDNAKLYLKGGTVEGTIRLHESSHETKKTHIIIDGAKGIKVGKKNDDGTITGGVHLGNNIAMEVVAYTNSTNGETMIYVRKDNNKRDNLVAYRSAEKPLTEFHEKCTVSAAPDKYIVKLYEGELVFADPTPVTPDPSEPTTEPSAPTDATDPS